MMELKGITAVKLSWSNLAKPVKECHVNGWYIIDVAGTLDNPPESRVNGYALNIDYADGKTIEVTLTKQAVIDMLVDISNQEKIRG